MNGNAKRNRLIASGLVAAALLGAAGVAPALAQAGSSAPTLVSSHPQRDTLMKMLRPVTVEFTDTRLEAVIDYIRDITGARIEALWMTDRNPEGLDKDMTVSVKVENVTFLALLERVLGQASSGFDESTWQMSETGELQVGTKERLNKFKRVEMYDISDLLLEVPRYDEVPSIDLQRVLQSSGGGGGGGGGQSQSPFRDDDQNQRDQQREDRRQEKADQVVEIIQELCEPDQWIETGGSGGSIRLYESSIIVNAPDYMHRAINGYPYWPRRLTQTGVTPAGRRYVSLTTDNGISTIDGFANQEVSAVVGGQIVRSGDPGGGGRQQPPADQKKDGSGGKR